MTGTVPLLDEFKARRQALGWSIRELGDRCGIDERLLTEWEHGVGAPRLDAAVKWAGALGLDLTVNVAGVRARGGLCVDWEARQITVDGSRVRGLRAGFIRERHESPGDQRHERSATHLASSSFAVVEMLPDRHRGQRVRGTSPLIALQMIHLEERQAKERHLLGRRQLQYAGQA